MIQKAFVQRWPIPPEYREHLVRRLIQIIANPNSKPREVTAAAKALLAAESQNQADEHKVVDVHVSTRHDRLDAIAIDLGLDVGTLEAIEGTTDRSTEGTER
jgi:histone acetyltransferase (RNA polymerase elongator complex component)